MGVPPIIAYCNDCLACFAPGMTPCVIVVNFAGIIKCPGLGAWPVSPPNGTFDLVQSVNACQWEYVGLTYQIYYKASLPNAGLMARSGGATWFASVPGGACPTGFANQNVCVPFLIVGEGGFARVSFVA